MGRRSAGRRRAGGGYHLYALPFVVFDATWLCPFIFPPLVPGPLSRGFLLAEEEWPFAGADALSDLTTIFACTWLAIHPNVPSPNDSRLIILSRKAMIMGLAILVPEYTTVWAFRQWVTARRITRKMSHRRGAYQYQRQIYCPPTYYRMDHHT